MKILHYGFEKNYNTPICKRMFFFCPKKILEISLLDYSFARVTKVL